MTGLFLRGFTLAGLLIFGASGLAFGDDHEYEQQSGVQEFTKPYRIKISGERVLIVTHACDVWDEKCTTKSATDRTVKFAKENGIPVIYLQDEFDDKAYFCEDKKPNFFAKSRLGEFSFEVPRQVITTGGYFSDCHRQTMRDLLEQWSGRHSSADVCLVTSAIYEYLTSQRLPAEIRMKSDALESKHGSSTVPLSEVLDLFGSDEARLEHLKSRVLGYTGAGSRYERPVLTDSRLVIQYRGKEVVVREGNGSPPFTLTYRFVHPEPGKPADLSECAPSGAKP